MSSARQRQAYNAWLSRPITPLGKDQWAIRPRKSKYREKREAYVLRRLDSGLIVCNCPGFVEATNCKHVGALERHLKSGPPSYYQNLSEDRLMYPQDWRRRAAADRVMRSAVLALLRDLAVEIARQQKGKK